MGETVGMEQRENAPWWEQEWFWDAYRPLMFDPDRMADTPDEALGVMNLLKLKGGDSLLDSCCGFGRHALELARRGLKVTGVDRQESYIREAREAAAREGLDVEFIQANSLDFIREECFQGAMNFFSSFGYFDDPEEEEEAVRNIHASLKPGGSFLIDVEGKELLARDYREREWFERNGFKILLEYRVEPGWTRLENRWIFFPMEGGEKTEIRFSHRIYSGLELAELLGRCGFAEVEIYGDLEGSPYDVKAKRLIAVARKL
jgi:SAM-dependent methyltransferase